MKNDIEEKLRVELSRGIQTEAQVVYLLVEIRKLIEHATEPYQNLSVLFFCEWALHIKMNREGARLLLKEIDDAIGRAATADELAELIGNQLSMDRFREDLIHVLMHHGLPTDAIRTMEGWLSFLPLYLSVITDCPVLHRDLTLQNINHLMVGVDRDPPKEVPEGAVFGFAIHWTFSKDKQIVLEWRNEVLYPKDHVPGRFYQLRMPQKQAQ